MTDTPTPDLERRVETMLATYERRGTTAVPGTVTLIRDLVAEVERLQAVVRRLEDHTELEARQRGGAPLSEWVWPAGQRAVIGRALAGGDQPTQAPEDRP